MRFQNAESSLELGISSYEFPVGGPDGDDGNWLVMRATYTDEEGRDIKDSNSCLLTYELRQLAAGLKVLRAGIKDHYESCFTEPYFTLAAWDQGDDGYRVDVSFTMPNTMEDLDTAEVEARMTKEELTTLIDELDKLCQKYPDRI